MNYNKFILTIASLTIIMTSNFCIGMQPPKQTFKKDSNSSKSTCTKELFKALDTNIPDKIRQRLTLPFDIDYKDKHGNNLLIIASKKGALALSTLLEDDRFHSATHINHQNKFGVTVLMNVCHQNDYANLQKLLSIHTINPNVQDRYMETAMHTAACSRNDTIRKEMIRAFARHGADFTIRNSHLLTPTMIILHAEKKLSNETLKTILGQRDTHGNTQFHLLATAKIEKLSLEKETDLDKKIIELSKLVDLSIWSYNNYSHLPIEIAVMEFEKLRLDNETHRTIETFNAATKQEKNLHRLLRYYATKIGKQVRIKCTYATHLNIETIVAQTEALDDESYYATDMDYRTGIKRNLSNKLSPEQILWVSEDLMDI